MYGACAGSIVSGVAGEVAPTEDQRRAAIERIRTTGEYESLDDLLRQADAYARKIAAGDAGQFVEIPSQFHDGS